MIKPTNGADGGKAPEGTSEREQTLAGLLKRCARCLPPDHATRKLATAYLRQHGYLSPLRTDGVTETPPAAAPRVITRDDDCSHSGALHPTPPAAGVNAADGETK
jgi:hypothetical protein